MRRTKNILKSSNVIISIIFIALFQSCGTKNTLSISVSDRSHQDNIEIYLIVNGAEKVLLGKTNTEGKYIITIEPPQISKDDRVKIDLVKDGFEMENIKGLYNTVIINGQVSLDVIVKSKELFKSIVFKTINPQNDIEIWGKTAEQSVLLGKTGANGLVDIRIDKNQWPQISFYYKSDVGKVVSESPKDIYPFDQLPTDAIELYIYPSRSVTIPIVVIDEITKNVIPDVQLSCVNIAKSLNTDRDGMVHFTISPEEAENNKILVKDDIEFVVDSKKYEASSKTINFDPLRYETGGFPDTIFVQKIYFLTLVIMGEGEPLDSAKINLSGDDVSSDGGRVLVTYKSQDVGTKKLLKITHPFYDDYIDSVTLGFLDGKTIKVEMQPIIQKLEIKSGLIKSVSEGLEFNSENNIKWESEGKGNWTLKFEHRRPTTITISDPMLRYEDKTVDISLDNRDNDPIKIKLFPVTYYKVHIRDTEGNNATNVTILDEQGNEIGKTDKSGVFLQKIRYDEQTITFRTSSPYYVFENNTYEIEIQPGENNIAIEPKAKAIYLDVTDFKTSEKIENLIVTSEKNIQSDYQENGLYRVLVPSLEESYNFVIQDPEDRFERQTISQLLSNNSLGNRTFVRMVPNTFVRFNVFSDDDKPILAAKIRQGDKFIGETNAKGQFNYQLDYDNDIKVFTFNKDYYGTDSVRIALEPGQNNVRTTLKENYLEIVASNADNGEYIGNIQFKINGDEKRTDEFGLITLKPKSTDERIIIHYPGIEKAYLPKVDTVFYDQLVHRYDIVLDPQPILEIHTLIRDQFYNEEPIENVSLFINGKSIGETDNNGILYYEIPSKANTYKLSYSKLGYLKDEITVNPGPTVHRVDVPMTRIIGKLSILNLDYDELAGIQMWIDGIKQGESDTRGHLDVFLNELGKSISINFVDSEGKYKNKTENIIFTKQFENHDIILYLKPIQLDIEVLWGSGTPAIGYVSIEPAPDPANGIINFDLKGGRTSATIFNEDQYTITYFAKGPNNSYISNFITKDIVFTGKSIDPIHFKIANASFRVLVNRSSDVNVTVAKLENDKELPTSTTVIGNGKDIFDASNFGYGQYKLTFLRQGWTHKTEKIVRLDQPDQLFDLRISEHYKTCMDFANQKKWKSACEECKRVEPDDPNYCDAEKMLFEIYRSDDYTDFKESALAINQYIANRCESNWSYTLSYFELLSKMDVYDSSLNLEQLSDLFDTFVHIEVLLINNPDKKINAINKAKRMLSTISINRMELLKSDWIESRFDGEKRQTLLDNAISIQTEMIQYYLPGLDFSVTDQYRNQADDIINGMQ